MRWRSRLAGALSLVVLGGPATARATPTPPDVSTFLREQKVGPAPAEEALLRIWMVYVGQGDGLVIELPAGVAAPDQGSGAEGGGASGAAAPPRRRLVLVDAGPDARLREFLHRRFPEGEIVVDELILTHHDKDHAAGIRHLLASPRIEVRTIRHNGLATWSREAVEPEGGAPEGFTRVIDDDWFMGLFPETAPEEIRSEFLIEDRAALMAALEAKQLLSVYQEMARALRDRSGSAFVRAAVGEDGPVGPFVELAAGEGAPAFELLWPPDPPRKFGGWSETINGNSVSFRLDYRDFEMLFLGDHNTRSEPALADRYREAPETLGCDVLKVPHHGSRHSDRDFLRSVGAVLSVASMGGRGFTTSWKHPSACTVCLLGGPERVYHTHAHEQAVRWHELARDPAAKDALVELRHVLIETDGEWFRLVEVPDDADPLTIPGVEETRRSDGTRWIRAAGEPVPGGDGCDEVCAEEAPR